MGRRLTSLRKCMLSMTKAKRGKTKKSVRTQRLLPYGVFRHEDSTESCNLISHTIQTGALGCTIWLHNAQAWLCGPTLAICGGTRGKDRSKDGRRVHCR